MMPEVTVEEMALNDWVDESSPSIDIPADWLSAIDTIMGLENPVTVICGPKNSGKSTFSRHLINVLLKRNKKVGYLDTDVGQPEFTAPGFLSYTVVDKPTNDLSLPCMKNPERCLFFGDLSSKRNPVIYLKYIQALYDYYQSQILDNSEKIDLPLVVNTSGWVKGVGYDVLVDILRYIAPTSVVKINTSLNKKNLLDGAFWLREGCNVGATLIEINSAVTNSCRLVRKDASVLRDFRIMAYFRQCFPKNDIDTIKELAHALAVQRPYQVPLSCMNIVNLHCKIPESEIYHSLNATIVGLATSSDKASKVPWCVGLGIIRSVDPSKGLLYVITPVTPKILKNVDTLVQGFIQIPTCLLHVQGRISPYMSMNVLRTG